MPLQTLLLEPLLSQPLRPQSHPVLVLLLPAAPLARRAGQVARRQAGQGEVLLQLAALPTLQPKWLRRQLQGQLLAVLQAQLLPVAQQRGKDRRPQGEARVWRVGAPALLPLLLLAARGAVPPLAARLVPPLSGPGARLPLAPVLVQVGARPMCCQRGWSPHHQSWWMAGAPRAEAAPRWAWAQWRAAALVRRHQQGLQGLTPHQAAPPEAPSPALVWAGQGVAALAALALGPLPWWKERRPRRCWHARG